jgi:FMN-dependent NADH-azoreductase
MDNKPKRILRVDASARTSNSNTRRLTHKLEEKLISLNPSAIVTERNLNGELSFLSETMVEAMFIDPTKRTEAQAKALELSDKMVKELLESDIVIIGVPVYNFSIPASLKAYIDMITRSGVTFKYVDGAPKGILKNTAVYIVVTSGRTPLYSDLDFVSGYMKHILGFIGITDLRFIEATQIRTIGEEVIMSKAFAAIENIGEEKGQAVEAW